MYFVIYLWPCRSSLIDSKQHQKRMFGWSLTQLSTSASAWRDRIRKDCFSFLFIISEFILKQIPVSIVEQSCNSTFTKEKKMLDSCSYYALAFCGHECSSFERAENCKLISIIESKLTFKLHLVEKCIFTRIPRKFGPEMSLSRMSNFTVFGNWYS